MTPDKNSMEVLSKLVEEALWKLQQVRAAHLVERQRHQPGPIVLIEPTDDERVVLKALIQAAIEHICAAMATSEIALAAPEERPDKQ